MNPSLNTTSSYGAQSSTQNPQSSSSSSSLSSSQSNLQPSSVNLLSGGNGVTINSNNNLPTESLGAYSDTSRISKLPITKQNQVNLVLLGVFVAIFLIAIIVFWQTATHHKKYND
jgi:hypothetical protein